MHDGRKPDRRRGHGSTVLRGAARQARIELRIQLFSPMVAGWLALPVIGMLVLSLLRGQDVMGSRISLAQLGSPGLLAVTFVSGGVLGVAAQLVADRDDGTLLRAKAVPHGMVSHLLAGVLVFTGTTLGPMLVLLAAAAVTFDDVAPSGAGGWATLVWVAALGMAATIPLGALLGALLRTPMMLFWATLLVYAGLGISGVFYPIGALPGWLQPVGRALPTYWIGVGLRSALLPPDAAALEPGGAWHLWQAAVALGVWAVAGLCVAPAALRAMARRQSGSQVAAARDRVMNRGY